MITLAELVGVPFLLVIFVQWVRSERARTVALDRRLDAELIPAAPRATPAGPGGSAASPAVASTGPEVPAEPERVRPWWESDGGIVGDRMRQGRP